MNKPATLFRRLTVHEVQTFCTRHQMAPSRFGRSVANEPALLSDMRKGRTLRAKITAKARALMAEWEGR